MMESLLKFSRTLRFGGVLNSGNFLFFDMPVIAVRRYRYLYRSREGNTGTGI